MFQKWLETFLESVRPRFLDSHFWNRADLPPSECIVRTHFSPSSSSQKLLKNFSAHSSLGGGPLGRPDVKFEGWTAGSGQCQIAPETYWPKKHPVLAGYD
ncbi:ORF1316 [White spot syndrome virus]|uniref:ORF1316 n=1 Tax=White spot syndrome virus TaxID=342409 RepID=A0A2D3I5K9_9VIRU|nr:ORF1316 [White spot syndrome virus]